MSKKRIEKLVELITYHNKKYWIDNDPEISDFDYDKLEIELLELDPENNIFKDIYSIKIQFATKRRKVKHKEKMLSLNKVYTDVDLYKWCKSISRNDNEIFTLGPKLDGVSGDFTDGVLATRGDGEIGENISSKAVIMNYIGPNNNSTLMELFNGNDRGEIIIKKNIFEKIKNKILKSDNTPYKTPRGLCSGLLMKDKVNKQLDRILHFVSFNTYIQEYTLNELKKIDWSDYENQIKNWDYAVDGLVIKIKDKEYSNSLGFTSHHPRGQIAFKFANPNEETKLIDIEWSMGKHSITPVGLIEPVIINNAKISRVSLHNAKFIMDRDLQIGDYVTIERAGEIIPYVLSTKPGEKRTEITLITCPQCGKDITYIEPEVVCLNYDCPGSNTKKLYDAVVRIGIENIGHTTVEKLYNIGATSLLDILVLTKSDIKMLPGFADKSIDNLYNTIQKIKEKEIEDWRIISCLNLKGIGTTLSKKLLTNYTLYDLMSMSSDDLIKISDIGPERAKELEEGLFENESFIEALIELFSNIKETKNSVVKGKVCFTGKGPKPRDFYKKMAEQDGFLSTNTVSKDLTYLVTDNLESTSSKMIKAKKYKTQILTYDQLKLTT